MVRLTESEVIYLISSLSSKIQKTQRRSDTSSQRFVAIIHTPIDCDEFPSRCSIVAVVKADWVFRFLTVQASFTKCASVANADTCCPDFAAVFRNAKDEHALSEIKSQHAQTPWEKKKKDPLPYYTPTAVRAQYITPITSIKHTHTLPRPSTDRTSSTSKNS